MLPKAKFIKQCAGQSETHSKRTQRYKKSNFTMDTESSVIPLVCYLTKFYKGGGGGGVGEGEETPFRGPNLINF